MDFQVDERRCYAYTGARPFDADKPSVVFVHGGGLDHTVWILQSRYIAHHGFNALALDLPGHGRCEGPLLASIEDMAMWVVRAMDALSIQRFAVVGHSMGSLVALHCASTRPERVAMAGLLGIAVPMRVSDELLQAARADAQEAYDMVNLWGHGYGAQIGGNTAPGMWMVGSANRLLERGGKGVLFNDLNACNEYNAGMDDASSLTCPTLILLGRQDIMASPRAARELIDAIDKVTVKELDPCGHMLMSERPDDVLDALEEAARTAFA